MKIDVEYLEYMWPMRHFLVTCGDIAGKSNIIAVSFCMPVSKDPPQLACAIGRDSFSYELIKSRKEFAVNVPPQDLKKKIYYLLMSTIEEIKSAISHLPHIEMVRLRTCLEDFEAEEWDQQFEEDGQQEGLIWFWIGKHLDYDRLISS